MELRKIWANGSGRSLAGLPADIIRIIIPMSRPPLESLRLISPSWNSMALTFLSSRDILPPLRRVNISEGNTDDRKRIRISVACKRKHASHFLHYFREWNSETGATFDEFTSPSLQLIVKENKRIWCSLIVFLLLTVVCTYYVHYLRPLALIFPPLLMAGYAIYRWRYVRPRATRNRITLSIVLTRCCFIENLCVDELNQEMMRNIRKAVGSVPVKKLILRPQAFKILEGYDVIQWASVCDIEIIEIITDEFTMARDLDDLRSFFSQVIRCGLQQLEFWENSGLSNLVFGRPRERWIEMARSLNCDEFTVHVANGRRARDEVLRLRVVPL